MKCRSHARALNWHLFKGHMLWLWGSRGGQRMKQCSILELRGASHNPPILVCSADRLIKILHQSINVYLYGAEPRAEHTMVMTYVISALIFSSEPSLEIKVDRNSLCIHVTQEGCLSTITQHGSVHERRQGWVISEDLFIKQNDFGC